jgi:hypothetical protein
MIATIIEEGFLVEIDTKIWRIAEYIHENGLVRIQLVNRKSGKPKTITITK